MWQGDHYLIASFTSTVTAKMFQLHVCAVESVLIDVSNERPQDWSIIHICKKNYQERPPEIPLFLATGSFSQDRLQYKLVCKHNLWIVSLLSIIRTVDLDSFLYSITKDVPETY